MAKPAITDEEVQQTRLVTACFTNQENTEGTLRVRVLIFRENITEFLETLLGSLLRLIVGVDFIGIRLLQSRRRRPIRRRVVTMMICCSCRLLLLQNKAGHMMWHSELQ